MDLLMNKNSLPSHGTRHSTYLISEHLHGSLIYVLFGSLPILFLLLFFLYCSKTSLCLWEDKWLRIVVCRLLPPAGVVCCHLPVSPSVQHRSFHTGQQLKLTVPLSPIWTSALDPWPLPTSSVKQGGPGAVQQRKKKKNGLQGLMWESQVT